MFDLATQLVTELSISAQFAATGDLLASGGDSDVSMGAAVFLLSGPAYFIFMFLRYRNTDKRHSHESETLSEVHDLRVSDQKTGQVRGVRNRTIKGANHKAVRGSLNKTGKLGF